MNAKAIAERDNAQCRILVVDDDRATAEEVVEAAHLLGYQCGYALDAASALRTIAEDETIGIVVTDVQMPGMTGLSLLDELSSRFASQRPLVTLVITGFGSIDVAVAAMRNEAADFLTKPVSRDDLAAALRRAMRKWLRLCGERSLAALSASLRAPPGDLGQPASPSTPLAPVDDAELLKITRKLVRMREQRGQFLNPALFSDPMWDILLDLTSARLEQKTVPVSSVCQAAGVPMSTALRQIRSLVDMGLIRRWSDPLDRRRDLLAINDEAMDAMRQYLTYLRDRVGV
ncbi:response regulator [Novosphingobium sp. NDB2Meth1]|uniref:response regulator n=1 Tax=Novosphingobium sp. NDB2Meth1 TaxID=1892847 RepID=UPI0009302B2A|nr:response regulator [Novosphingobium sp. NDB2Meth1]